MAEYIEREKAIREIINLVVEILNIHNSVPLTKIACKMRELPTADVVEVVRCKDCKYFEIDEEDELGECKCGYIAVSYNGALYPHRTDYCSYGERRCEE